MSSMKVLSPLKGFASKAKRAELYGSHVRVAAGLFAALLLVCNFSQSVQAVILLTLSLFSFPRFLTNRSDANFTWGLTVVGSIIGFFLILRLVSPYRVDPYYFLSELKFVTLFFIPGFLRWALSHGNVRSSTDVDRAVGTLLKLYISFLIAYNIATLLLGVWVFRSAGFLGFSINAAYGLVYLAGYTRLSISRYWQAAGLLAIALLGSTAAIAMYLGLLAFYNIKSRVLLIYGALAVLPIMFYYSLDVRGKDLLSGDYSSLDRVQIINYFIALIRENFTSINYAVGYGPGHEFLRQVSEMRDLGVISGWLLLEFAINGVYSFAVHSEYLRIFIDFGLIGTIIIAVALEKVFPWRVIILLAIGATTNTTLFSSNNLFVLSIIIAAHSMLRASDRKSGKVTTYRRLKWKS